MSIKKQYRRTKTLCKVVFELPAELSHSCEKACLVGDFNSWSHYTTVMKRRKDGIFTVSLDLEKGKDYQFRYLLDGNRWENDWNADEYVSTPYGSHNSVVKV